MNTSSLEAKLQTYLDKKEEQIGKKLDLFANMEKEKAERQVKSISVTKKNIDKKINEEVGKQLSGLKEDRIRQLEQLSKKEKKAERRKLLRDLLEKELDQNFS